MLRALSPAFAPDNVAAVGATPAVELWIIVAGAAFAVLTVTLARHPAARGLFFVMAGAGLALRLMFFGTDPILEDDWRRYLWEGAAGASGVDPYAYAPAAGMEVTAFGTPAAPSADPSVEALRRLGAPYLDYPERVNHPYLTSIYPLPAQWAFRMAHAIAPFSLDAFRFVLLIAEAVSFALLLLVLRAFGRRPELALLYWLNPLVILQTFSAVHMDALIVPPLLLALLAARHARPGWTGAALGLAAAMKIWPLALLPIFGRRFIRMPLAMLRATAAMAIVAIICLAPLLARIGESDSGLFAYATGWVRNAFVFASLEQALSVVTIDPGGAARVMTAILAATIVLVLTIRADPDAARTPMRALTFVMFLLALSPTAYPWYGIWAAVFLPFAPTLGAALLAAGAGIYVLRFPNALTGEGVPFLWLALQTAVPLLLHLLERRRLTT